MHDATRRGGFMYHQLPSSGHMNHCYFTYTGRFFFDLARFNGYDLMDFSFTEPGSSVNSIYESVQAHARDFRTLKGILRDKNGAGPSRR